MPRQADADRIVEVIGIGGSEIRHGSGCIVAGRTVLTAAHVVRDATHVIVRSERKQELALTWPPAGPRFIGYDVPDGPDLALVELDDPAIDFSPLPLAALNRDDFRRLEACQAIGYPWVAETDHDSPDRGLRTVRNVKQVDGWIPLGSSRNTGMCALQVAGQPSGTDADSPPGRSVWSGLSGSPVLASGCLVGVVTDNSPHEDASVLLFTPLTLLEETEGWPAWGRGVPEPGRWWRKLGAESASALRVLPGPRHKATYPARVRQIADLIRNFEDRDEDLRAVAGFAHGTEGYRLLEGVRFAGKTAMLAKFVTGFVPGDVDVVSFFVSRQMSSADSTYFLAAVIPQLVDLVGGDVHDLDVSAFYNLWQLAARGALQHGRHLLLVVDGLDEDRPPPGAPSIAQILPVHVAGLSPEWRNAHVLVSNRKGVPLPSGIPDGHQLKDLPSHQLTQYSKNVHYEVLARQEIAGLLGRGPDARKLLGTLTAARGALSVADLARLTRLPAEQVEDFLHDAHRSMPPVGDGRYAFDADFLSQLESTASLDMDSYRAAIRSWARDWQAQGWRDGRSGHERVPRYLVEVFPETLRDVPDVRARLAGDPGWIAAAIRHLKVDSVLAMLGSWVRESPGYAAPAAMLAIIRGQAAFLRSVPDLETSQLLRQLCLQAAELAEYDQLAALLTALEDYPGLAPQWSSRRPDRGLIAELNVAAGWVNAVALTPLGRIVVGADDGVVRLWDPSTPAAAGWVVGKHDRPVRALAVHPDGRIISAGDDRKICLWSQDLMNSEPQELGRHDGVIRALAIVDADRLVSGGDDWWVRLWSLGGQPARAIKLGRHAGNIRGLAADGHGRVVSGADDGRILLWDLVAPGAPIAGTQAIGVRIMTVAFAPDGSVIAGGNDGIVYRWRHKFCAAATEGDDDNDQLEEFGSHGNVVRSVAATQDGIIVSGSDDGRLRRWQRGTHGTDRSELGRHDGAIRTVCAQGGHAVSGGRDQKVRFWDLGEAPRPDGLHAGPPERVMCLCVLPDGAAISGGLSRRLWLWDPVQPTEPQPIGELAAPALAICSLPGTALATADAEGTIQAWEHPAAISRVDGGPTGLHRGALLCMAGELLVSGGYDGRVIRWQLADFFAARPAARGLRSPATSSAGTTARSWPSPRCPTAGW